LPAALFIVDIHKEHIAVAEAKKLGVPTFAIVDTNSNPNEVDFAIPANDDSSASVAKILDVVCASISEGLSERKASKEAAKKNEKAVEQKEA
jgi:small subunit ribosomal protein S2